MAHGENFAISQWSWNGLEYTKKAYFKFSVDKDKVCSNLRNNRFCKNNIEIYCVSSETNLLKIQIQKGDLTKSIHRKFLGRNKRTILDYRIIRADRVMALTDDDMLYLVDTYQGAELSTYSLIDMQHKNIFTFNGDQFNLDNYPLIMEDTDDGRLWFVNMKTSKEKFQRRS